MADWDTGDLDGFDSSQRHSRQSSNTSSLPNGNKEDYATHSNAEDDSSDKGVILHGGEHLSQESITDNSMPGSFHNHAFTDTNGLSHAGEQSNSPRDVNVASPGTAKAKAAKSPYAPSTADSIPEEEIIIPKDANISAYTMDQIANFLRCLKIDDRIISHLYRKKVDGKRFSRLKDSELENIGMKNPVILFFRDKSSVKIKKKSDWVL